MKRLTDTTPEAEQVLRAVLREMPFARKWLQMGAVYQTALVFHAARVRQLDPVASADDIRDAWTMVALGKDLASTAREVRHERGRR